MAAKKPKEAPANDVEGPVQLNLRTSRRQADELDEWVKDLNKDGRWPKLTRNEVLRRLLEWGLEKRPEWVGK